MTITATYTNADGTTATASMVMNVFAVPILALDADMAATDTLNCNIAHAKDTAQYGYCNGTIPFPGTPENSKLTVAIDSIAARGGVCATIAATLTDLLSHGNLVIAPSDFRATGGSPQGGGTSAGWVAIHPMMLNANWPNYVANSLNGNLKMTLQYALVHEADHVLNNVDPNNHDTSGTALGHLAGNNFATVNSQRCSDIPAGQQQ